MSTPETIDADIAATVAEVKSGISALQAENAALRANRVVLLELLDEARWYVSREANVGVRGASALLACIDAALADARAGEGSC